MYELPEPFASIWMPLLLTVIWCLWWWLCTDWKKLWPVLARGGWAPALLLVAMAGAVWAQLDARDLTWPGYYLPSFAWHLAAAILLAALALFCGWLQAITGWVAPEFAVHSVPAAHGQGHDHGQHH